MNKSELEQWLKTATHAEVDRKLLLVSRELNTVYGKYMTLRAEAIKRESDRNNDKVKVKGNILMLTHAHINSDKLRDVIKEISFNTTYRYVMVGCSPEDDCDPYSYTPIVETHKTFIRVPKDRLILEDVDFVNNDILCSFRIDGEDGDYLFVNYNRDTDMLSGNRQIIV